jgi:hypothetical protein
MAKVMTVINWVGGIVVAFAFFYAHSDHSWRAAVKWAIFFLAGLAFPAHLARRARVLLNGVRPPLARDVRGIAVYPIWAALVMLFAALMLIADAATR